MTAKYDLPLANNLVVSAVVGQKHDADGRVGQSVFGLVTVQTFQ